MALLIVEHMPTLRALLEVAEITQEDSCQRLWVRSGLNDAFSGQGNHSVRASGMR